MLARTRDIDTAWFEIGRGPALILLHGLADDHRLWRKVLPALVMRNRVILYDIRGHGQSTLGNAEGNLQQLGDDLVALMDVVDVEKASLAGFSLGGTIVLRVAIDHPERVESLFPVATSSRVGSAAAQWYRDRADHAGDLRAVIDQDTVDAYHISPGELEDGLALRRQSTVDPAGYRNAARAMAALNAAPLDPELGKIKAPTLVISTDLDQHCPPRAGEIVRAGIPGAVMQVINGSGHMVPAEKPADLGLLIQSFLTPAALSTRS